MPLLTSHVAYYVPVTSLFSLQITVKTGNLERSKMTTRVFNRKHPLIRFDLWSVDLSRDSWQFDEISSFFLLSGSVASETARRSANSEKFSILPSQPLSNCQLLQIECSGKLDRGYLSWIRDYISEKLHAYITCLNNTISQYCQRKNSLSANDPLLTITTLISKCVTSNVFYRQDLFVATKESSNVSQEMLLVVNFLKLLQNYKTKTSSGY
ncbi:hypothetical protein WN51_10281 [Melipona quadrifasciata]|uniref:Uncharacterized protein n=1 Tax=Melipona quadrifasciata TaxID=166423 RepID=A0A0N0BIB2_9HYME|nr:hypothetical protein WN51_10281 [Melipona quadrifasciata]